MSPLLERDETLALLDERHGPIDRKPTRQFAAPHDHQGMVREHRILQFSYAIGEEYSEMVVELPAEPEFDPSCPIVQQAWAFMLAQLDPFFDAKAPGPACDLEVNNMVETHLVEHYELMA